MVPTIWRKNETPVRELFETWKVPLDLLWRSAAYLCECQQSRMVNKCSFANYAGSMLRQLVRYNLY